MFIDLEMIIRFILIKHPQMCTENLCIVKQELLAKTVIAGKTK